jgi:eukaryotic-like serine/threonine-protein kinase
VTGDREKSDSQSRIGTTIAGKYHLDRLLGKGGMGAVYEATHTGIDRKFALKVMHTYADQAPDSEARFEREARAAGRIGHPNIVDVFDFGRTDEGAPYIVMELCPGESLAERLVRGPLEERDACEVAVEMLRALEAAHGAGIVHRDIKPANVFLCKDANGKRTIKVLDFGIAKFVEGDVTLTHTGAVIGSPLYMAPEQVRAEKDVDARADIWSVGATLYEMLSGVAPHRAPSHAAVIARIVTVPAVSVRTHSENIDPQLDAIVLRALCIDKMDRFVTAEAMRVAIDNYMSGSAATVASLPPLGVSQSSAGSAPPASPNRTWIIAGAVFLAAVAITFLAVHSQSSPTPVAAASVQASAPSASALPETTPTPPVAALSVQEIPSASAVGISDPPPPTHSAKPPTPHSVPTHSATSPNPTCASGEQISLGHCCRVGLVWQDDRCDRPLATTAPF